MVAIEIELHSIFFFHTEDVNGYLKLFDDRILSFGGNNPFNILN